MNENEEYLTVVDEEGNEQLYEILFTFDSDEFDKSYILYYPAGADKDENGEIEIHASSYVPSDSGEQGSLMPITTDEEWDMIEEMLNTYAHLESETEE